MSKPRKEYSAALVSAVQVMARQPAIETTDLHGISPAAERARQLRMIQLLEQIAATLGQDRPLENK
jgi:hypothetical protein